MNTIKFFIITIMGGFFFSNCTKDAIVNPNNPTTNNSILNYGDTIFYIKSNTDNFISPINLNKTGRFFGFPKGIELDSATGKIDVNSSETGLRYIIKFVPTGTTDTIKTKIVISGINFLDKIYNLSLGDSIAPAIYNASGVPFVSGQFGVGINNVFDDGNGCNNQKCAVSLTNGSINLEKSIRDGAIANVNDAQKEFSYYFRMDDKSNKGLNRLKFILYYYNSISNIPQYLWDIINIDHAGTIVPSGRLQGVAKPRPPCIIVIQH